MVGDERGKARSGGRFDGAGEDGGSAITVLVAVQMGMLRHALVNVLSEQGDIEVVAAVENNAAVAQVGGRVQPDVMVIEVGKPELATLRQLRAQLPRTPIVALVAARPTGLLTGLLDIAAVGAVDKNGPTSRLLDAVRGAAKGELVVDATLAMAAVTAKPNPLTARERDVLRLAANGATGPEIAIHLHLAHGTVRNYLSNAIAKTGAQTRIDAVRIAQDAGWL